VVFVLKISPHAAMLERLFSLAGNQKTAVRNCMKTSTLKNLLVIKMDSLELEKVPETITNKKDGTNDENR
jgi:hypothetical protein